MCIRDSYVYVQPPLITWDETDIVRAEVTIGVVILFDFLFAYLVRNRYRIRDWSSAVTTDSYYINWNTALLGRNLW